jgi:multisubunit Na+/H+ antiporter MnhE subunit
MPERSRAALVTRRITAWAIGWLLAAALYLLLIDITDLPELLVGAGAAALAATGLELAREQGLIGDGIRRRWLLRLYRPIMKVPTDILIVSLMAVRAIADRRPRHGTFRALPFNSGGDAELASGRRALVEAMGSLAPNTFVIGIDEDQGLILAHQLRRMPSRKSVDVLEVG